MRQIVHSVLALLAVGTVVHAGEDDAVPTDQGERMEKALLDSGNRKSKLILVRGANHGLSKKGWSDIGKPMINFLNREVGLPELN